jgi:AcrR family transcriptional regulator
MEESVQRAGEAIAQVIHGAPDATPVERLDRFLAAWRTHVQASDFRAGCPVLAVAIEFTEGTRRLHEASERAFASWRRGLSQALRQHDVPPARARRLATLVVASIEGAVVLSRVERDLRPLDDVGRELRAVLRAATAPSPS